MNAPTGRLDSQLTLPQPYLLFLGDTTEAGYAKTAFGLADWAADRCVGEWGIGGCTVTTGLPHLSPAEARAAGARSLVIGVANQGGIIGDSWVAVLVEAMEAGLDIVSGLHVRLTSIPALADAARRTGQRLIDVRTPPPSIPIGNGRKRSGKRLLTVGTDCSVGKMYTTLCLTRGLQARGVKADFRATGQTGILIAGDGVPLDAVVADFISGAIEQISPDRHDGGWDLIEGQGSLFHPSFAGVSTGLIHGAQPDALVLCHDPMRQTMRGLPHYAPPSLEDCLEANLRAARLTNPDVRAVGIALNTSAMEDGAAAALCARTADRMGMPCCDPYRMGVDAMVDLLIAMEAPAPATETI